MDAQDHYREAERLITVPKGATRPKDSAVARAQVHATLALAAITAEAAGKPITSDFQPALNP